jgi:NAD(P)-dependent dehydrogenase (short-subunit alcohol dehydrogenase family)
MMTLDKTIVVILGGSSGIGLATARAAEAAGASVIITGRNLARLERARTTLGSGARTQVLDAADEGSTSAFFAELGALDHLFITAGTLVMDAKLAPPTSALEPALSTRFWGALYAAKYASPRMRAGGSITFTSGVGSRRPLPGAAVASASCGAVDSLARALAVDLAPLRVNSIQPGYVDTPLFDALLGRDRDSILAAAAERLPVKRIGRPEEIADAVLFLMRNGYITGINLVIDGGGLLV